MDFFKKKLYINVVKSYVHNIQYYHFTFEATKVYNLALFRVLIDL